MKEISGSLKEIIKDYNVVCLPTSGFIKADGTGMITKSTPTELVELISDFPTKLGRHIKTYGNNIEAIAIVNRAYIVTFPIMDSCVGGVDLNILERSCQQLMRKTTKSYKILLPRLAKNKDIWEGIKVVLEKYLDERVTIIS